MLSTSWNWVRTREKWEPSQNTFPHVVQMKNKATLESSPTGSVWTCSRAPLGNVRVSGSRSEAGAQRQWGAYLALMHSSPGDVAGRFKDWSSSSQSSVCSTCSSMSPTERTHAQPSPMSSRRDGGKSFTGADLLYCCHVNILRRFNWFTHRGVTWGQVLSKYCVRECLPNYHLPYDKPC